jgi:hypothetical protein
MPAGIAGAAGAGTSFFAGAEEEPEQATEHIAATQAAAISAIFFINTIVVARHPARKSSSNQTFRTFQ